MLIIQNNKSRFKLIFIKNTIHFVQEPLTSVALGFFQKNIISIFFNGNFNKPLLKHLESQKNKKTSSIMERNICIPHLFAENNQQIRIANTKYVQYQNPAIGLPVKVKAE